MAAPADPLGDRALDDISNLVSETLNLLGPSAEQHVGYEIDLHDTPEKPAVPVGPPAPLDPLSPGPLEAATSENIDLSSPVSNLRHSSRSLQPSGTPAVVVESEIMAAASPRPVIQSPKPESSNDAVHIRVKEPERTETATALGIKTQHWVYPVVVDSKLPGLVADGMEVKRRFSDFDALHKLLHLAHRGCFIPPLPQKTLIENNSEEFLRLRRADLQAFLRSLASHPTLQQSDILKVFLLQPGELNRNPAWLMLSASHAPKRYGLLEDAATAASTSGNTAGSAALANLSTWVTWVKQSTAPLFQPVQRELPPGEEQLRQVKELLQDLERLLQLATHSARTMCQDMEKMSADYREFGFNMGMLSKYEDAVQTKLGHYTAEGHSASNRAADFTKFAACHAKQHGVWKALSQKAAANLVVLHDYSILVPEAVRAMEERETALDQVFLVQEELAQKRQQLEVAQGPAAQGARTMVSAEKRVAQLSQSISTLQDQLKSAQDQYETIKARNQSELARLGLEREADFRRMMASFAANQAHFVQASADLWASLATQFSAPSANAQPL